MAFPSQSNFTNAGPEDAWWIDRREDGPRLCNTSGLNFIRVLQTALRGVPRARSFDGNYVAGSQVSLDGVWGPITSRVLWSFLKNLRAPDELLTAVATDARARRLTRGSLVAAVWLIRKAGGVPLAVAQIDVPTDVVPPAWMQAPPITANTGQGIACPPLPLGSDPGPTRQPVVPPGTVPVIDAPVEPEAPLPTDDLNRDPDRPSGVDPRPSTGTTTSWGLLLGVGAAVAVVVGARYMLAKDREAAAARRARAA